MILDAEHIPVMNEEIVQAIDPQDGEVYLDGTFGAGGYTTSLLQAADCTVIGVDRDSSAFARAEVVGNVFGERFQFVHGCFSNALTHARSLGYDSIDGFVLDLGVSSMQLDEAERGFSFRNDGPLDMRMDQASDGETAADVVNEYKEEELADIIYHFGEERYSRRVARAIVAAREDKPFERTAELASVVRSVVPKSPKDKVDQATRTFQALRIHVNQEMQELQSALEAAEGVLKPGGRLVVVSFHSLEDGIVKRFLQERSGRQSRGSRHMPDIGKTLDPTFTVVTRKPVVPTDNEVSHNPRARSARMRVAIRTEAPVVAVQGGHA